MLKNTEAYVIYRKHSQQILDFSALTCTAVPQLKHAFASQAVDPAAFVAQNSHFRPSGSPYSTEKRAIQGYTTVLGATLVLSIFSYFETYFFSAIDELLEFHGGEEGISRIIKRQLEDRRLPDTARTAVSALRTNFDSHKADKYRKFSAVLEPERFAWPSHRFMLYGLKQAIAQKGRWRSVQIPEILETLLNFPLTQADKDLFHSYRNDRNKIAHGKNLSYDLKKALEVSNNLRDFALRIDQHIVKTCFIIEKFAHR